MSKFKLDLSKFKKVSTDAKSTTLKHPAGHEIKIAHSAVGPEMKKQLEALPHFDLGGEASNEVASKISHSKAFKNKQTTEAPDNSLPASTHDNNGDAIHAEAIARYKAKMAAEKSGQAPAESDYAQGGKVAYYDEGTPSGVVSDVDSEPVLPLAQQLGAKAREYGGKALDIFSKGVDDATGAFKTVSQPALDFAKGVAGDAPSDQDSPPQSTPPQSAVPEAQAPAEQPSSSIPQSLSSDSDQPAASNPPPTMSGARDELIAGATGASHTMADMYKKTAGIQEQAQVSQQKALEAYKNQFSALQSERDQLMDDIKNQHIDPNRLFNDSNALAKVGSVLGLVAGGIGGALTGHGGNVALDYLNKMTDQDIEAQKADLGKKESLLSANFRKFGDLKEATAMTKIMQADLISSQLAQQAAKSQSALEKSRLLTLKGQIDQGMAPAAQALSVRSLLTSGNLKDQDPAAFVPFVVPENRQAAVASEISHAWETRKAKDTVLKAFDEAAKDTHGVGAATSLVKEPRSIGALHAALGPTFNNIEHTVRQAAMDNMFGTTTPNRYDNPKDLATKRKALVNYIESNSVAPNAKMYGIDLSKFTDTSVDPTVQMNAQQKQFLDFAKKYPNDPRSAMLLKKLGVQ